MGFPDRADTGSPSPLRSASGHPARRLCLQGAGLELAERPGGANGGALASLGLVKADRPAALARASTGGKGARHTAGWALCLESQAVPNAIHIPTWRDDVVLRPGRTYRHRMVFRFHAE